MAKFYKVTVEGNTYEVEVEFLSDSATSTSTVPTPVAPQQTVVSQPTGTGTLVTAPMQGNIWKIVKQVGETVQSGDTILILEAMKMENNIVSPKDGTLTAIPVKEGDAVDTGATLFELA